MPYPFTPHGYLDNPYHSAVANRSGVLRSVPPLGLGFWCRRMPWPYGEGTRRETNYLCLALPTLRTGQGTLAASGQFEAAGWELGSDEHTKNVLSLCARGPEGEARFTYFLIEEDALGVEIELIGVQADVTVAYGYPETRRWGSDGTVARLREDGVSIKMWAGGDAFHVATDAPFEAGASPARETWLSNQAAQSIGAPLPQAIAYPGALYTTFRLQTVGKMRLVLARGPNERKAHERASGALRDFDRALQARREDDAKFWSHAPQLNGDWPEAWKEGWRYDFETIRSTVRQPVGIYQHLWDGMQIFTPRAVLGEAMLDALCLSYGDPELAKEMILGTFADAPEPNVPCSREDGSMNMVGMSGEECGTAPTWGIPFHTIRAIYERTGDREWLKSLMPHLEAFLDWWLAHRTDADGWFHCDNSWESGQDGSKRFLIEEGEEGRESSFVRTVDVEATMAEAFQNMSYFASETGLSDRFGAMAEERIQRTQAMFHGGSFRDWDGRTETPIVLPDYRDVMMLMPLACGVAAPEQSEAMKGEFDAFVASPRHWLEWPSFMYPFTEAAANAGRRQLAADTVAAIADRVYARTTRREAQPPGSIDAGLPEAYNYRIPGVASEFWPIELDERIVNGAECYGWGATLPTLILRNLLGFRERTEGFELAVCLPAQVRGPVSVGPLHFRGARFTVHAQGRQVRVESTQPLQVRLPNGETLVGAETSWEQDPGQVALLSLVPTAEISGRPG